MWDSWNKPNPQHGDVRAWQNEQGPGLNPYTEYGGTRVIQAPEKWRQEDQESKLFLGHTVSLGRSGKHKIFTQRDEEEEEEEEKRQPQQSLTVTEVWISYWGKGMAAGIRQQQTGLCSYALIHKHGNPLQHLYIVAAYAWLLARLSQILKHNKWQHIHLPSDEPEMKTQSSELYKVLVLVALVELTLNASIWEVEASRNLWVSGRQDI